MSTVICFDIVTLAWPASSTMLAVYVCTPAAI
jgi:hypothetical protein